MNLRPCRNVASALRSCLVAGVFAVSKKPQSRTVHRAKGMLVPLLVLLSQFASLTSIAAEPPTVSDFRGSLGKIRDGSMKVQGAFRIYRTETVNRSALTDAPEAIKLPLQYSGKLWRNEQRFRADYKLHAASGSNEYPQSVAVDTGEVFELTYGAAPAPGLLQVYEKDTPEGTAALVSIKSRFYEPLDSLWSLNGVALVDLLQRPDTTIQPNKVLAGGYSLLVSSQEVGKTRYELEFDPSVGHPFGYGSLFHEDAGIQVKAERRVFSQEREGILFPSRVVDVVTLGAPSEGYTQVVEFDLTPLQTVSPISNRIEPSSFETVGEGYQVYTTKKGNKAEIGGRHGRPPRDDFVVQPTVFGKWRTGFLWANGFVILVIVGRFVYLQWKARTTR